MENRAMPRAGEFYMHFKGKLYQIVTVAIHTETEEPLVVYQAMYGTFKTYARPLAMFLSEVDHEKYPDVQQTYRFQKVELCENAGDQYGIKIKETEQDSEAELVDEVTAQENECDETEETADIEPLLKFLDETDLHERLNILLQYRDQITETMLESMGMAMDCVLNGKTLEESMMSGFADVEAILKYTKQNRTDIQKLNKKMEKSYQKLGIVKYDAFNEMGGKLSFALAMLDNNNTGWIINAMHSREGCYTYVKEIVKGESYVELAEEEAEALDKAIFEDGYEEEVDKAVASATGSLKSVKSGPAKNGNQKSTNARNTKQTSGKANNGKILNARTSNVRPDMARPEKTRNER